MRLPRWTRQACVFFSINRGQLSNRHRAEEEFISFLWSILLFFYSFFPEKLSLSIDAIGNPMKEKERKDGRCASVESVVSRADINYTFLINFLMNRCVSYFGQRKNSRILSSIVILMMVIVFSLSLQGRWCTARERERQHEQTVMFKAREEIERW